MRILVLGGTRFLGRAIVESALAKHHEVTLFHRGQSGPDLFEGRVQRILGDRNSELGLLENGKWDAIVDTCGYVPRIVRASAQLLAASSPSARYLFVSSISVYADPEPGADETWPVATLDDSTVEAITGETYGPLKALCEAEVRAAFPESHLVVRPGLIVGPHDPTDRFTYWPCRMARGGDVLVPARRDQSVQIVDVRDLAAWCVLALESGLSGTFNITAPETPFRLGDVLESVQKAAGSHAALHWVDPAKLAEWGVVPWTELPLYIGPETEPDSLMSLSIRRAEVTGFRYRPLQETIEDTLRWAQSRPEDHAWKAGLSPEREQELLNLWWS